MWIGIKGIPGDSAALKTVSQRDGEAVLSERLVGLCQRATEGDGLV